MRLALRITLRFISFILIVLVLIVPSFAQQSANLETLIAKGDITALKSALDANPALANGRDSHGRSFVHEAVLLRQTAIADLFLSRGAKLEAFDAAALGKNAELKSLLASDPDSVNRKDEGGRTPLLVAGIRGHDETVRVLLQHGAVADVFSASAAGLDSRLEQLLAATPVAVNAAGPCGPTPLSCAVQAGRHSTAELLIRKGAQVNAKDNFGTALFDAARRGDRKMVELLLRSGADRTIFIPGFGTASTIALASHHPEIAELLK